jgi:NAD-binding of NADP-dependent 3-hydroxyisobutyrate dehydrogenase
VQPARSRLKRRLPFQLSSRALTSGRNISFRSASRSSLVGGVPRAAFLEFLNKSVMGSMFTRYKAPAIVNLDFTPTFTPALLYKDFALGFEVAKEHGVPMPVAAAAQQVVQALMGFGYENVDFMALIELEGRSSGLELEAENAPISDGLSDRNVDIVAADRPA